MGSILRQNQYRRDAHPMEDDDEMWFNKDYFFASSQCDTLANGSVTQTSQAEGEDVTSKLKNCLVSCPIQNGIAGIDDSPSQQVRFGYPYLALHLTDSET